MQESIITQAGVSYVRVEYKAMVEDVDAIQMDYMKATGIRMVLMALVTMMAAVCVVFLSSRVAASMGHDLRGLVYNKVIGFSSREYHKFSTASLITRCTNDIQQVQQVMAMFFRIVLLRADPWNRWCDPRASERFLHDMDPWGGHCTDHGIYGNAVQDRNAEIYSPADHGR